jgi:hypothetical protein
MSYGFKLILLVIIDETLNIDDKNNRILCRNLV